MIVELELGNYLSFKNRQIISFRSSKTQQHKEHVPVVKKVKERISPVACFFGPNSAGKTNVFKALDLIKNLAVAADPNLSSLIIPFKLDESSEKETSFFRIQFVCKTDTVFELSFSASAQKIFSEKLTFTNYSGTKTLYSRNSDRFKSCLELTPEKKSTWDFMVGNTASDCLLLNTIRMPAVRKSFAWADEIYYWFNHLYLVTPRTKFLPIPSFASSSERLTPGHNIEQLLKDLNTGLDGIKFVDYSFSNLATNLQDDLKRQLKVGMLLGVSYGRDYIITFIDQKTNEFKARKLTTYHKLNDSKMVSFNLSDESDGVRRLIDLGPVLLALLQDPNVPSVFIIDELDRSLHTLMTKQIIECFLSLSSAASRRQMIFTCHDILLMDSKILRQDQMFIIKKDKQFSEISRIHDMPGVRADKDIMKLYLEGKLGGIPKFPDIQL